MRPHRKHVHFVFAILQSGLTSLVASGIASRGFLGSSGFFSHWMSSWVIAWIAMLPVVVLAAPAIRSLAYLLTREE